MKIQTAIVLGFCCCFLVAAPALPAGEPHAPGVRVLGGLSETYTAVTFDHPKHVSIAGNCQACHHHGNGSTCKECHNLSPEAFRNSVVTGFMPCSNCHGAYDRENAAMPGLKAAYHQKCFACHRGMGNIGLDPKGCAELCHAPKTASP